MLPIANGACSGWLNFSAPEVEQAADRFVGKRSLIPTLRRTAAMV